MVSCSRRKPKKPSHLLSVLDWFRILCSGCFGKIDHLKRPLLAAGNPHGKLSLKISQSCLRDNIHTCAAFDAFCESDESMGDDGDDASDDSEGIFHGHFLLGSTVLTEVELQSPVEESRVLATPIRTPRRSNNSSSASSTRDLQFGFSQVWALDHLMKSNDSFHTSSIRDLHLGSSQVCALDSDSLDENAVISPSGDVEAHPSTSMLNVLSTYVEGHKSFAGPYRCSEVTSPAASHNFSCSQLDNLDCGEGLIGSSFTGDHVVNPSLRESNNHVDVEKVLPCIDSKQSNRKHLNPRSDSAFDCSIVDAPLKGKNSTHRFAWRAAETLTPVQEGQDFIPVGSLPDCTSDFLAERMQKKSHCRRLRARSLTDQDFTELKGCIDLGFVFSQDHVPDLRETLPALEVCYAVAHGAISPVSNMDDTKSLSPSSPPISPWRVASPGDQPQQVKARLRHWAQAVACNVRHPC